jgi:thioredoxin 1
MSTTTVVTDDTFQTEVLESEIPVLVDVWATWCGPCRQLAPVVEQLAQEYAGRLTVVKLDADANPSAVSQIGVVSIPTLAVYRGGQLLTTVIGARPKAAISATLDEYLL